MEKKLSTEALQVIYSLFGQGSQLQLPVALTDYVIELRQWSANELSSRVGKQETARSEENLKQEAEKEAEKSKEIIEPESCEESSDNSKCDSE